MNTSRVGPIAGVVSVVLTVVSLAMTGSDMPDFIDDPESITSYYADDPGKLIGGYIVDSFGTILLIVFAAALYVRLGGVRRGTLPPAAFGGAIAMAAMFMVYDVINMSLAFRADEDGAIPTEAGVLLNDLSFLTIGVGATMFAAVFVGAAAFSALGSGVLPRWLCYLSFPLALGLLIAPISWIFLPVLLLWVLAVSVLMWLQPETAATTAA
jgi:Flp pilus assembly pilin Flp